MVRGIGIDAELIALGRATGAEYLAVDTDTRVRVLPARSPGRTYLSNFAIHVSRSTSRKSRSSNHEAASYGFVDSETRAQAASMYISAAAGFSMLA